jgi:hypothetical protein
MLDDKLFGDKHISDILEEFYNKNKEDASMTNKIIDVLKLTSADSFTGMFGEEDRAKLLNVLLTSKQKCTHNYKEMLDAVAKLQKNALDTDENDLSDVRKYMKDDHESNEEILKNIEDNTDNNVVIFDEDKGIDLLIKNIESEIKKAGE